MIECELKQRMACVDYKNIREKLLIIETKNVCTIK